MHPAHVLVDNSLQVVGVHLTELVLLVDKLPNSELDSVLEILPLNIELFYAVRDHWVDELHQAHNVRIFLCWLEGCKFYVLQPQSVDINVPNLVKSFFAGLPAFEIQGCVALALDQSQIHVPVSVNYAVHRADLRQERKHDFACPIFTYRLD